MLKIIRTVQACLAIILSIISLGTFILQFTPYEYPCLFSNLQRLAIIGIAFGFLMNIHYRIRTGYYAFSLLCTIIGGIVSLKQISMHACPSSAPFADPICGFSLYTWRLLLFAVIFVLLSIFLFLYTPEHSIYKPPKKSVLDILACIFVTVTIALEILHFYIPFGSTTCLPS